MFVIDLQKYIHIITISLPQKYLIKDERPFTNMKLISNKYQFVNISRLSTNQYLRKSDTLYKRGHYNN